MTDHEPLEELPQALQDALQGLGGERAPEELWHRVSLARSEQVAAPKDLWDRVAPVVAEEAAARASKSKSTATSGGRVLSFPTRRWVAAAAVFVAGVSTALLVPFGSTPEGPSLAAKVSEEEREVYRSRFVVQEVSKTEMSPTGRSFVAMFGGDVES